jgi:hypothetical protein
MLSLTGFITMSRPTSLGTMSQLRAATAAALLGALFHKHLYLLKILLFTLILARPALSHAQLIDTVDVQRRGDNAAEVVIRFTNRVQYLRHAPRDSGRSLRIYVSLFGAGFQPADLVPQSIRLPKQGFMPQTTVSFPETGNAIFVSFDQQVQFTVSPGTDGRSVVLLLRSGAGG